MSTFLGYMWLLAPSVAFPTVFFGREELQWRVTDIYRKILVKMCAQATLKSTNGHTCYHDQSS
jgi:hypothetical protein